MLKVPVWLVQPGVCPVRLNVPEPEPMPIVMVPCMIMVFVSVPPGDIDDIVIVDHAPVARFVVPVVLVTDDVVPPQAIKAAVNRIAANVPARFIFPPFGGGQISQLECPPIPTSGAALRARGIDRIFLVGLGPPTYLDLRLWALVTHADC
jgi:hypothetical protein